jgi:predicted DNA-binding protein
LKINKPADLAGAQPQPDLRLVRKKYACRLPLELASRLEALCEMHPKKTRTQLMADLLRLGLAEVERASSAPAAALAEYHPDTRQPIYLLTGPFAEFHGLVHKHHLAMEQGLDKEDPQALYLVDDYLLEDEG